MEASALQAPAVVPRNRSSLGTALLRLRSDEQLVALFRAGHDEAFRVIHDRYRQRLFAYTRQMLPLRQDAEDALQDVFVRAYGHLRASDRELALRAWLYRVAHNRCIDELRRPAPPPPEALQLISAPIQDPIAQADQRESLRRLVDDVRRLPDQQRSALLMRELDGMSYAELADVLSISVPAVKSLLVRARMALALAAEARETACGEIREELILAHDRRTRPAATARRHIRDCPGCAQFRRELRGVSRRLAALTPAVGPVGLAAKLLGLGGGAGGGVAASGGSAAVGGAAGAGGALASAGVFSGGAASHVATLIAAALVTAGGTVELQGTITPPAHHRVVHHARRAATRRPSPARSPAAAPAAVVHSQAATATVAAPAPVVQPAPATVAAPAAPQAPSATPAATPAQSPPQRSPASQDTVGARPKAPVNDALRSVGTVLPSMSAMAGASTTVRSGTASAPATGGATTSTPEGSPATGTATGAPGGGPAAAASGTPESQPTGAPPSSDGGAAPPANAAATGSVTTPGS